MELEITSDNVSDNEGGRAMTVKKSTDVSTSPSNPDNIRDRATSRIDDDIVKRVLAAADRLHEVETRITVTVSANGKLELPPELQAQLKPFTRYEVFLTNNEIVLKKIPKSLAWLALSARINSEEHDLEQPSLEEITEIVKETRRLRRAKTE
jgi:C4-type Zn-finger protein